ncbi:MAG: hypothetical protein C5B60_01555 [Chloroflexi bacterium]|nr:MAG: hypothetical protein C5B60_01555 [Chloroflexota bacterium]
MNPGPTEEVGKVATSIVESLKTQPLMLVVMLFNIIFLAVIYFGVTAQRQQTHEVMKMLLERCGVQKTWLPM